MLHGADSFSLHRELDEIKKSLGDSESLSLNTAVFEGRHLMPSQLIEACTAVPFLASHRLVIVEGLLERFEPSASGKRPLISEWQPLIDFLPAKPPSTVLVFIDGKLAKNNAMLRKLAKAASVHEFPVMKGPRLEEWVRSRAAEQGAAISPRAIGLLIETAGEDLWVLANEIDKLALYAKGGRIEEAHVVRAASQAREASIFAMVDAIAEKRLSAAMRLLHQLLNEGTPPTHLLTMMGRQVRLMLQAKELARQRLSLEEKREQLGLSWNFPIDKLFKQSAAHSRQRLIDIYQRILDTDVAIKSGKWPDELALDLLVVEVCS
ncbi:MAG: DNA polymerase III subunit delta [Dehalococcoidia bacterium]|nr:DNA polymerase III subunit delta [Dehalococcoidia bacterium]